MDSGVTTGVSKIFSLLSASGSLNHEQRLCFKKEGRPCPRINLKNRDSGTVYENFPWICGDEEKNTYFCWPCLIMGDLSKMKKVSFVQQNGFQSSGANFWNISTRHQASKKHIFNYTEYKLLGNVHVACALDEERRKEIQHHNQNATRYSRMLQHHIDTVVFLAAQGLEFRDHDESKMSSNRGNFIELLDILSNYSHELRSFLDSERITYTSHESQNDLIECVYEELKKEIQRRVDQSRFVAVMMDDTSDASNIEQSAVSVRLVHDGEVEEHLLGMIDSSSDQSANGLTKILLETLESYEILPETSAEKLIGQSYDGAATMSGELSGVQKQINNKFPAAYYNHCVAHRMSLCASQSANKIPKISKFFDNIDKLIKIFRSTKRKNRLGLYLPQPGDTCWLSRDTAIGVIDSQYETIGTVLFEFSNDANEKAETQAVARELCLQMQHVEFVYFLKLYGMIFARCSPIITVMQKTHLDDVQLSSMLDDFKKFLSELDFDNVWDQALSVDPELPTVRRREGWRGVETGNDGSQNSWKLTLSSVAQTVTSKFSEEFFWRFENLKKFKWMDLIHPTKFEERRKVSVDKQKELIQELSQLYPFAIPDLLALEHNLNVLYNNSDIKILLDKIVQERDALAAKRREISQKLKRANEEGNMEKEDERLSLEEDDTFEASNESVIEIELIKEGEPNVQDLLEVIKRTELEEALPCAMILLELAVATPLTSVHCERVFSRMKRVVSPIRSRMLQKRKEMLVFLQVEHKTLRWLAGQPLFETNIVNRFKAYNRRRFERFSRKYKILY